MLVKKISRIVHSKFKYVASPLQTISKNNKLNYNFRGTYKCLQRVPLIHITKHILSDSYSLFEKKIMFWNIFFQLSKENGYVKNIQPHTLHNCN